MQMEFILEYGDEEFLIILSEFVKKDKVEVFRIRYSDQENDCAEYEIQVFMRQENDFIQVKVMELSEFLKEIIGKNIQDFFGRTFTANPYFDELLIFAGSEVFTYQEKLKLIECTQCDRKNLYEKYYRGNKSEYVANLKGLMESNKNPDWPFKEKLLVQFSISNTQSKLNEVDLDNLAKTILDIFKGTIYVDDSQVVSLAGNKESVLHLKAFIVAIRRLEPNEKPLFQEYLWSSKMNAWQDQYKIKRDFNKPTRFIVYGSFKKNISKG
jgi:Holliday junction resolvase RusA-like endonuclease